MFGGSLVCVSPWAPQSPPGSSPGGSFTDQLCAFDAPSQAGPYSLRQMGWSKE